MSGGHLVALQSLAWARMTLEYAKKDGFTTALTKTFNGRSQCGLCLKVQKSWAEQQEQEKKAPGTQPEQITEALWNFHLVSLPQPPRIDLYKGAFASEYFYQLSESPPKPPPRA